MAKELAFQVDAEPLQRVLLELELELVDAPLQVRELALDFIDGTSELCRVEQGVASGAVVPILLEPSQGVLDFLSAVRARDFDALLIKYSH